MWVCEEQVSTVVATPFLCLRLKWWQKFICSESILFPNVSYFVRQFVCRCVGAPVKGCSRKRIMIFYKYDFNVPAVHQIRGKKVGSARRKTAKGWRNGRHEKWTAAIGARSAHNQLCAGEEKKRMKRRAEQKTGFRNPHIFQYSTKSTGSAPPIQTSNYEKREERRRRPCTAIEIAQVKLHPETSAFARCWWRRK